MTVLVAYKVTVIEQDNGKGYAFAINGHTDQPNWDIGETYENQLGWSTRAKALKAGRNRAQWMADMAEVCEATGNWPSDPYGYNP